MYCFLVKSATYGKLVTYKVRKLIRLKVKDIDIYATFNKKSIFEILAYLELYDGVSRGVVIGKTSSIASKGASGI